MAEKLGVTRQYISQIENGRRTNINTELLLNASLLYGVSPAYLLGLILPGYAEVGNALYVRNLLPPGYGQLATKSLNMLCEKIGFDPEEYCRKLGITWGWDTPNNMVEAEGADFPTPHELPKKDGHEKPTE